MTLKEYVRKNLNVPNVLTVIRLALVPVYLVLFVMGRKYAALFTFMAACFTDLLDGKIARKYNLITDFGKVMDPLADKVMVVTAMLSMCIGNKHIPGVLPWLAVLIVMAKEGFMIYAGIRLYGKGVVVYSSMAGKVAHCLFILGLVMSYFHDWFASLTPGWPAWLTIDLLVIWLAVISTLLALRFYVNQMVPVGKELGLIKKSRKERAAEAAASDGAAREE
ncbi:MAG: CDP-alcohol phosphatidyltransferase family protein [Clostridiales bacterium]|nr:CDP-alcohol phosphatidyltransferase family protein [Clostridiales bacterium]